VVYRLSPENVRPPRGGPSGAAALAVVLGLAVGIWFLAGGDPGSQAGGGGGGDPIPTQLPTEGAPSTDPVSGLPYVAPAALPPAALDLFVEVTGDSPPAGTPFEDVAGALPAQQPGYYTVHVVGSRDSGLELVAGEGGEVYWTTDGEASFSRVGP
jgi:hypothetical protein